MTAPSNDNSPTDECTVCQHPRSEHTVHGSACNHEWTGGDTQTFCACRSFVLAGRSNDEPTDAAEYKLIVPTSPDDVFVNGGDIGNARLEVSDLRARLEAVTTELDEARGLIEAHCIHGYENDQHYPHDGPHELPTWREIVQLRSRASRTEAESQRMAMILSRIDEYVDFNIHNKMHKVLLKAILEGKKVM